MSRKFRSETNDSKPFKFRGNQRPKYNNPNNQDDFNLNILKICGIKNLGNNCYLNSGLQILASCEELVNVIKKDESGNYSKNIVSELKDAFYTLLDPSNRVYDPINFINCFCSKNYDFIRGSQCNSQSFIRSFITIMNNEFKKKRQKDHLIYDDYQNQDKGDKYSKFKYKNYPQSKAYSIFSIITKHTYSGECYNINCLNYNKSYSDIIYKIQEDFSIDLPDDRNKYELSYLLNKELKNDIVRRCPQCREEIELIEETTFIKLPEIFIFSINRFPIDSKKINKIKIIPDDIYLETVKSKDQYYSNNKTEYKLFAINIRKGEDTNFGYQICQVKEGENWYEIDSNNKKSIINDLNYDYSDGLFYRRSNK